jgi:integrase
VRALEIADYKECFLAIAKAAKSERASAPVGPTKTNEVREVPVDDHAHSAGSKLAAWIRKHVSPRDRLKRGLLFPSPRGGMLSHSALIENWHRACASAGMGPVALYQGTRHSAATHLYAEGLRDAELRGLMGHRRGSPHIERYRQIARRTGLVTAMKGIPAPRSLEAANNDGSPRD